jgi:predicted enzyme related to lactoylglutathione lyase
MDWRATADSVEDRLSQIALATLRDPGTSVGIRRTRARDSPLASASTVRRTLLSLSSCNVNASFGLIEFPADDPDRARRFWSGLLGVELAERRQAEGRGWQTQDGSPAFGIHQRGAGPGDTASLPYFNVADMEAALEQVTALGGSVIHPGAQWSICRDSEGSPFALAVASRS